MKSLSVLSGFLEPSIGSDLSLKLVSYFSLPYTFRTKKIFFNLSIGSQSTFILFLSLLCSSSYCRLGNAAKKVTTLYTKQQSQSSFSEDNKWRYCLGANIWRQVQD